MATNERLAPQIPAGTGLNGHCKELSGVAQGKHQLFTGGSPNLPITSSAATIMILSSAHPFRALVN
jgi:hypothetical protein